MLKKLSLAALVAMGSMSVASATPLTEAIKGVSLNGFMRIRYYYHQDDNGKTTDYNRWRTNAKLVFGIPVAENMKIVWRVNAQQDAHEKSTKLLNSPNSGKPKPTDFNRNVTNSLFFLNYAKDCLVVNAGIVPLGALPFASSDPFTTAHGAGVVAMYNVGNGLTVAGGYVDHIFNANGTVNGSVSIPTATNNGANDVYTGGAIYSNEAFGSAQLWGYKITNVIKYSYVLMTDLNFLKDQGIDIKADYATSELAKHTTNALGIKQDNHDYYRIALAGNISGIEAEAGYAGTNDKTGAIATSDDAKIGQIPTELRYNVANLTDVDVIYAKLGYDIDENTKVWASYANIDQSKKGGNHDSNEFDIEGSYKINKKFGVSAYYANLDMDKKGDTDQQEVRVQFLYNF